MTEIFVGESFDKATYEAAHDELFKATDGMSEVEECRNRGWDLYRGGYIDRGMEDMLRSLEIIRGITEGGGLVAERMFAREQGATRARLAQAFCVAGELDDAFYNASHAIGLIPSPIVHTRHLTPADFGERGSSMRMNAEADQYETYTRTIVYPDQYEITFSGRMALILAGSSDDKHRGQASRLAARARRLAGQSEDHNRVMLADKKMEEDERNRVRSKSKNVARLATASLYLPSPISLKIAQKVCAR